jgi:hypothetical protein
MQTKFKISEIYHDVMISYVEEIDICEFLVLF